MPLDNGSTEDDPTDIISIQTSYIGTAARVLHSLISNMRGAGDTTELDRLDYRQIEWVADMLEHHAAAIDAAVQRINEAARSGSGTV